VEEKIAKLLAMAEGTTNPHEAEAFMAKAEELMLQHGIDRANLEAKKGPGTVKQEIVVHKVYIPNGHGYASAMAAIGFAIAPSFSVRTLQASRPDGAKTVWLIGHVTDVQDAEQLLNSLVAQSRTQALYWWRTEGKYPGATDNEAYLARREFIYAFAKGAGSRLRETRNRVVAEAGPGTELVLVDRGRLVDSWVESNLKVGTARASSRRTGGEQARSAGHAAGREAVSPRTLPGNK
jgi:hypothetical protein